MMEGISDILKSVHTFLVKARNLTNGNDCRSIQTQAKLVAENKIIQRIFKECVDIINRIIVPADRCLQVEKLHLTSREEEIAKSLCKKLAKVIEEAIDELNEGDKCRKDALEIAKEYSKEQRWLLMVKARDCSIAAQRKLKVAEDMFAVPLARLLEKLEKQVKERTEAVENLDDKISFWTALGNGIGVVAGLFGVLAMTIGNGRAGAAAASAASSVGSFLISGYIAESKGQRKNLVTANESTQRVIDESKEQMEDRNFWERYASDAVDNSEKTAGQLLSGP